jgi:hypothetical protein
MSKKQVVKEKQYYCRDCMYGVPDMKFENLSLEGKPTLLKCPYNEWKKLFNEPACKKFKHKPIGI